MSYDKITAGMQLCGWIATPAGGEDILQSRVYYYRYEGTMRYASLPRLPGFGRQRYPQPHELGQIFAMRLNSDTLAPLCPKRTR